MTPSGASPLAAAQVSQLAFAIACFIALDVFYAFDVSVVPIVGIGVVVAVVVVVVVVVLAAVAVVVVAAAAAAAAVRLLLLLLLLFSASNSRQHLLQRRNTWKVRLGCKALPRQQQRNNKQ